MYLYFYQLQIYSNLTVLKNLFLILNTANGVSAWSNTVPDIFCRHKPRNYAILTESS